MSAKYNIQEISARTGIPKDLLRQWERRYGYPNPERDANGNRIYSNSQLDKLLLIHQLLDQGKRPGKLIHLEMDELKSMLQLPEEIFNKDELIRLLKSGQAIQLGDWLQSMVHNDLRRFVHKVMSPAITAVGSAWEQGEITVYEEHIFTEIMKRIAHKHLAEQPRNNSGPKVMLTTVPGEKHTLGLLMVEIILRLGGAKVISFGTEMPFNEIREAAEKHGVDILGLSFSGSYKAEDAVVMLAGLRQAVRPNIHIWSGGAAFNNTYEPLEGVEIFHDLQNVEDALAMWNQQTATDGID
jgi:methanogenic corrinoid protein MtbC1